MHLYELYLYKKLDLDNEIIHVWAQLMYTNT